MSQQPADPATAAASSIDTPSASAEADRAGLIRKLFEDHNRALVAFLAARLHSRAEARDVAQEAYVRMLELEEPGAVSFLRAYLFRIAANLAVDRLRRRTVREQGPPQALFEELLAAPGPERTVLARQELEVVKDALRDLPRRHQEAFALYMFDERSVADIAVLMKVTPRRIRHYLSETLAYCRVKRDRGAGHGGSR